MEGAIVKGGIPVADVSASSVGDSTVLTAIPVPMPAQANVPPPFLSKTYDMVDDLATDAVVSWSSTNNSFIVWNQPEFARDLLPKYFKHNNFASFVRQLNTYGFRKVDPDRWEFANEGFLRGQKHLLKTIMRRKPAYGTGHQQQQQQQQPQQSHSHNPPATTCVEVGKFGLEEEVERLKRDKNVLMQELVRLRQQQQTTDSQLQAMVQRLQGMEQRQQQMMTFLAKAMQSPGFLAQFVQQQNETNRRITEANKKRRLRQEGACENDCASSPDGQIIKYQPLLSDGAKAMLRQILKMDASSRFESSTTTTTLDSFLIDNGGSPRCSSSAVSGIQSSFSGMNVSDEPRLEPSGSPQVDVFMPALSQIPGLVPESLLEAPNGCGEECMEPQAASTDGFVDPTPFVMNESMALEIDNLSSDTADIDELLNNYHFWSDLIADSPIPEDLESTSVDDKCKENGWDPILHADQLAAQMEFLSSDIPNL